MPLTAGDKLGPYEIITLIGEGGMGVVYRARDPRLGRDVAVKVNSNGFSESFEREARAVAALNHPNICHVYDVGPNYLAMELIEGESLKGPLPLETALDYARQIALALEEAHEKGIIHRDLKPANIKIKPDDTVKVLDFGLAKLPPISTVDSQNSPTMNVAATQEGIILGTAAYMAPEQARGKAVDRRADIWAFGVVLYEMLTGKRLFEGDDVTETLAAVVMKEPDFSAVPEKVRRLLKQCLEKDPRKRLQAIGDWRLLLNEPATSAAIPQSRAGMLSGWFVAAALVVALASLGFVHFNKPPEPEPEAVRFEIEAPQGTEFGQGVALAPDGRRVAFVAVEQGRGGRGTGARSRLWVRPLNSNDARAIPGTEGARSQFFWSSDNRTMVFSTGDKLRKISIDGGPAQPLTDFRQAPGGGFFTDDHRIVFGTPSPLGIVQIPAAGGEMKSVTSFKPDGQETYHAFPWPLPDGNHFLFRRSAGSESGIYVGALDAKPENQVSHPLLKDASAGVYAPPLTPDQPGHLLFVRESTLLAQPFDPQKLQLSGEAVPVGENVAFDFTFSAAANGVLAYLAGPQRSSQATWYDRKGMVQGTVGVPAPHGTGSFSADGSKVALERSEPSSKPDIWVVDVARNSEIRVTTDPASDISPVVSWDGSVMAFTSTRDGTENLYKRSLSSAAGVDELLFKSADRKIPIHWSRDGQYLLFEVRANAGAQLWLLLLSEATPAGGRQPIPLLRGAFSVNGSQFSPDGHWIAYVSNQSGSQQVYVRRFDANSPESFSTNAATLVSTNGTGFRPRWSSDGKELIFMAQGDVMSAQVTTNPSFHAEPPKKLFTEPEGATFAGVTQDGQRILLLVPVGESKRTINVILNWQALLPKK